MLQALYKEKLRTPPGVKFVYSDINYITLGEIVGRVGSVNECPYDSCPDYFADANIFQPLGLKRTRFFRLSNDSPSDDLVRKFVLEKLIAPTENIKGQNSYLGAVFEGDQKAGDQILRGQVHDPTAYRMGGVAGHAGLFST